MCFVASCPRSENGVNAEVDQRTPMEEKELNSRKVETQNTTQNRNTVELQFKGPGTNGTPHPSIHAHQTTTVPHPRVQQRENRDDPLEMHPPPTKKVPFKFSYFQNWPQSPIFLIALLSCHSKTDIQ